MIIHDAKGLPFPIEGDKIQCNPQGIFYRKDLRLYPVHPGIPLVQRYDFTIGINENNTYISPIYNPYNHMVIAQKNNHKFQYPITREEALELGIFMRLPYSGRSASTSRVQVHHENSHR